jgi:oligopeptide transport system substrate-binding protein
MTVHDRTGGWRWARTVLLISALSTMLLIAGCTTGDDDSLPDDGGVTTTAAPGATTTSGDGDEVDSTEPPDGDASTLTFSYLPITSLDHQVITGRWWPLSAGALLEGLVAQNDDATDVVPAAAESWEVSDDGLTYTFVLRDGATWSNGDPVTAEDFVWSYQRLLDPSRSTAEGGAGANSYRTNMQIVGAVEYLSGETTDWDDVGIEAVDDRTIVFELSAINPGFLEQLTNYSMLPLHPGTVEAHPEDWSRPENWVGNGPFVMESWDLNQSMVLVARDDYWNSENIHIDRFVTQFTEAGTSAELLAYQNDEIDFFHAADFSVLPSDGSLDPDLDGVEGRGTFYLNLMASEDSPLVDVRVREALALAIDREIVAEVQGGAAAGVSLLPSSVPGWDPSMAIPFDVERAQSLLAEAGYPGGEGFGTISLLSQGSGNAWLEVVGQMWEENLGITTNIDITETGVYADKRNEYHDSDYFGYYARSHGGTPTLATFVTAPNTLGPGFAMVYGLDGEHYAEYRAIQQDQSLDPADRNAQLQALIEEHGDPVLNEFNDLVDQAFQTADAAERDQLLVDAAIARQDTYRFIPVLWQNVWYVRDPAISGLHFRPTTEPFYLTGVEIDR